MPYQPPVIRDIFGCEPEEGMESIDFILSRIHPDDIDRLKDAAAQSAHKMETWKCEWRYLHTIQGEVWLAGIAQPVRSEGGAILLPFYQIRFGQHYPGKSDHEAVHIDC
jgi:hypothetical protein